MRPSLSASLAPRRLEVVTPEGVPLAFELAGAGDRAAGFLLDVLLQLAATVGLAILLVLVGSLAGAGGALIGALNAFGFLAVFLVRNFYFVYFELNWQGRTPGKKLAGTQVIDRHGDTLTADAVFARNLTRELEFFLPLTLLLQPHWMPAGESVALAWFSALWLVILGTLPLWNRDRLRAGDLIGGTLVVRRPQLALLEDVTGREARGEVPEEAHAQTLVFTPAQLDIYGVYELQVLEDVLRRPRADDDAVQVVARKIQDKIGWEGGRVPARAFLQAFYDAQRSRLEHELLLGQARERKRDDLPPAARPIRSERSLRLNRRRPPAPRRRDPPPPS